MTVQHKSISTSPARPVGQASRPPSASLWLTWRMPALTLFLLALIQPLSWPHGPTPLWFPTAGLGLVLIAWFGPRAALLILIAAPFAALRTALWSSVHAPEAWGELL